MRFLALAALFCTSFLGEAAAQPADRWLIVPSATVSEASWAKPTASNLRAELLDGGVEVWSLNDAATRFEERVSAPASAATESDIQRWVAQTNAAVEDLVQGDPSRALDRLSEAAKFSRNSVDALNRDTQQSQQLLDTCLYEVRALLDIGAPERAEAQAQE
ncbi:MAG: hypothetical protein WCF10_15415, partial [Polyangiales bacterium]